MKKIFLLIYILSLFPIYGCKDDDKNPCNLEGERLEEMKNDDVQLFFTTLPNGSYDKPYILYIDGSATLVSGMTYDVICNFPSYVAEWDVPIEGIRVKIAGIRYRYLGFYPTDRIMYDLEVTSLKRK